MTESALLARTQQLREVCDHLTLGVVRSLEKRPGVVDVRVRATEPLSSSTLGAWELQRGIVLPEDLRGFLLTTNGLDLCWSAAIGDSAVPVGRMHIHGFSQLSLVRCEAPAGASEEDSTGNPRRYFSGALVELDSAEGLCRVAQRVHPRAASSSSIINTNNNTNSAGVAAGAAPANASSSMLQAADDDGVWVRDMAGRWHRIAATFAEYFRLLVAHLGIPGWQYAMTSMGLSPLTEQWMHIFAPSRLVIDANRDASPVAAAIAPVRVASAGGDGTKVSSSTDGQIVDSKGAAGTTPKRAQSGRTSRQGVAGKS